jgi:nucleoside-diphosphate-sugar epimerase
VIPYTIYGGNYKQQKVIDLLFQSLTAEEPIKLSDGFQQFDFIHIDDICSFFVTLINCIFTKDIKNDEVFHLGTGKPYSLREIASLIEKQSGKQLNIEWGATKPRERDTIYACASIAKNIHLLGWEAKISIEERLKTIDNF